MFRKFLTHQLEKLNEKRSALAKKVQDSDNVEEVRSLMAQLSDIDKDIVSTQAMLDECCEDEGEARGTVVNGGIASHILGTAQTKDKSETRKSVLGSVEYRTAFKAFIQKGTPIPADLMKRAGGDPGPTITEDIGLTVPTTIMNEFIKKLPDKAYGRLFGKARKINVRGGVKFPITDLKAAFKWITETTVSPRQKAGDIKEYVEFSYNIGEIRVSQTLLSAIEGLEEFESMITEVMLEAYVEAHEKSMFLGTGKGQPLGILNDTRITNVVEFTAEEFADWKQWRKKLFAKIPISLRRKGEFVFPVGTVESNLMTMEDGVGRPIFKDAAGVDFTDDSIDGKFFNRVVNLVEPDIIADFDDAEAGDVVGVYYLPSSYVFNTPFEFGMKRYFDEETNQWVNKGITVTDGKMLDVKQCWIIKKAA